MLGPALEAAEYAIASFEAKIDAKIGRAARRTLGRYLVVVMIGIPVAWVACGFTFTRDGFFGIVAGVVLYALLQPFRIRRDEPPSGVERLGGPDVDLDDPSGARR